MSGEGLLPADGRASRRSSPAFAAVSRVPAADAGAGDVAPARSGSNPEVLYPAATEAKLVRLRTTFEERATELLEQDPVCFGRVCSGTIRALAIEAVDGVGMTLVRRAHELLDPED
jgi:hypothetical protein